MYKLAVDVVEYLTKFQFCFRSGCLLSELDRLNFGQTLCVFHCQNKNDAMIVTVRNLHRSTSFAAA